MPAGNGFTLLKSESTETYFGHDALKDRVPVLVGDVVPGAWPRNFLDNCDTVPVAASTVLGLPFVEGKEVIVRRPEAESEHWTARTIAAAEDRLEKEARPPTPNE